MTLPIRHLFAEVEIHSKATAGARLIHHQCVTQALLLLGLYLFPQNSTCYFYRV